jgi:hypothetical protein
MENSKQTAQGADRIRKEVRIEPIEVSRLYKGNYQKEGTITAELKQTIETKSFYPTKSVSNNMQDNPFATKDFGFQDKEYTTFETRVTWIPVPEAMTEQEVVAHMAKITKATIYRVLSNKPSISDAQQAGINAGQTTLDIIANAQAIRYPKDHSTHAGKLIPDTNGKVQYRAVYYSNTFKEDIDSRTADVSNFYLTDEIRAEIQNAQAAVAGQTLGARSY